MTLKPKHPDNTSGTFSLSGFFAALILLFSPLVLAVALYFVRPGWLMQLFYAYTGMPEYTLAARINPDFLMRPVIETLARIWPVRFESLALVVFPALAAILLHSGKNKYGGRFRFAGAWQCLAFGCFAWAAGWLAWPSPFRAAIWTAAVAGGYCLNFVLPASVFSDRAPRIAAVLPAMGAPVGVSHLFMPVQLLVLIRRLSFPGRERLDRHAVFLGRAIFCIAGLGTAVLVFLSGKPLPVSPQARLILEGRNFYDLEIDPVSRRLLVTDKYAEYTRPCHALSLDDPETPPQPFVVPSFEVEEIALDAPGRNIYHVERFLGHLICLHADSLEFLWMRPLSAIGGGSVALAVDSALSKLIVLWENDYLSVFDIDTGAPSARKHVGPGATMVYDEKERTIYCHSGPPWRIDALDLFSLKTLRTAPAPRPDRMAASFSRNELYVSDAIRSRIWVYELPSLTLRKRIPCQFGVRALAVDEARGILFAAGTVAGKIQLFHLDDGSLVSEYRVGGMSRRIVVDPQHRRAFVTIMHKGLYVLDY